MLLLGFYFVYPTLLLGVDMNSALDAYVYVFHLHIHAACVIFTHGAVLCLCHLYSRCGAVHV